MSSAPVLSITFCQNGKLLRKSERYSDLTKKTNGSKNGSAFP